MKNLEDLGVGPFPYIVYILRRPLSSEVIKGKHFVLVDLLKSLQGGSSQAEVVPKPLVWLDHLPLAVQDPKPTHQTVKKKKKKTTGEGCQRGTRGVRGLDESKN